MDLVELEIFAAVARAGSFASAARRRGTDPSSISRSIGTLEAELGTRLFHRTTRSLTLTEAGERFSRRTDALLEDFAAARAEALDATDVPSGIVRITASVGFSQACILPLLPELLARHDRLNVDLVATDANLDLAAQGIDLAIRFAPRPLGDYVSSMLRPTVYRVVASPGFAANHEGIQPGDLSALPCLCFPLSGFRSRWLFRDRRKTIEEVPVHGRVQVSSSTALRDLAVSGVGVALLADWLVDDHLKSGRLVDLFPGFDVTATEFETAAWLLYPSRKFLPAKTRAVIDFLRQRLGRPDSRPTPHSSA